MYSRQHWSGCSAVQMQELLWKEPLWCLRQDAETSSWMSLRAVSGPAIDNASKGQRDVGANGWNQAQAGVDVWIPETAYVARWRGGVTTMSPLCEGFLLEFPSRYGSRDIRSSGPLHL